MEVVSGGESELVGSAKVTVAGAAVSCAHKPDGCVVYDAAVEVVFWCGVRSCWERKGDCCWCSGLRAHRSDGCVDYANEKTGAGVGAGCEVPR